MNNKVEFKCQGVELRCVDDFNETGKMVVSGYVNLTEQFSNMLHTSHSKLNFVEKISSGAFANSLNDEREIDFLAEHDEAKILSSTRNNSLSLVEDDKGLFMSAIITPTSWGQDYYTLIKDGILQNLSFGFRAIKDRWNERADGILERVVDELELFEVSVVKNPAYPQSCIQARNLDIITDEDLIEKARGVKRMKDLEKQQEVREAEPIDEQGADKPEQVDELAAYLEKIERSIIALEAKADKIFKLVEENIKYKADEELTETEEVEETEEIEENAAPEETTEEEVEETEEEVEEEVEVETVCSNCGFAREAKEEGTECPNCGETAKIIAKEEFEAKKDSEEDRSAETEEVEEQRSADNKEIVETAINDLRAQIAALK